MSINRARARRRRYRHAKRARRLALRFEHAEVLRRALSPGYTNNTFAAIAEQVRQRLLTGFTELANFGADFGALLRDFGKGMRGMSDTLQAARFALQQAEAAKR